MTTFTKEQLVARIGTLMARREESLSMKLFAEEFGADVEILKIALASLEAEPDYIRYDCGCCGWETLTDWRDNDVCPKCNHKPLGTTELFTAPPAPVVPDDLLSAMEEVLRISDRDHEAWHQARAGIVACRAAMQGKAEPVIQSSSLRDGVESLRTSGMSIDAGKILEERDTGNSPVIPDGWVMVPVEPTWDMLSENGCKEHHNGEECLHHDNRRRIWRAMLAAGGAR